MTKPYLRDLQTDAIELLKEGGQWIVAGVKTDVPWPKEPQVVPFDGMDFILRPLTKDHSPTVCLNTSKVSISAKDGRDLILKFGSALAFAEGQGFEVHTWIGGSSAIFIGRGQGHVVQDFLEPEYLPVIPDEDAATAMALYREGLSSESNFYAFLSLYKVISFVHRDGKKRGEWIEATLPTLTDNRTKERLAELQKDGINASEYLRDFGRHAIAHAEKDFFVNPDRLVDHERIFRDLPIMRALARRAIEERFQLFPRLSLNAPQKSDIPGFERIFWPELIEKILSPEDPPAVELDLPDEVTVLVRRKNKIVAYENLTISGMTRWKNGIGVVFMNGAETLTIIVGIDFRNKKLVFEPCGNCGAPLNKASRSSIELQRKLHELIWLYQSNGHLELWNSDTDEFLGKTDAYIPMNMYLDNKLIEDARAQLQRMLDEATEG